MSIRVSDLLDDWMDDSVDFEIHASARSAEHIKEAVMQKINLKKRRKVNMRVVVIAAAIMVILATTAAAVTWRLQLRQTGDGEVLTYDDPNNGEIEYTEVGAVLNVAGEENNNSVVCYDILFRPAYLPGDPDAYERHMYHGSVKRAGEPFVPYLNAEELLAASGMTETQAQTWYDSVWYDSDGDFIRIDIYSGALTAGTDFLLNGTVTLQETTTINSMEATRLTVDYAGTYLEGMGIRNHILLYHEQYHCMIDIVGTYSLEELEKVAEGLSLYQTAAEATDSFNIEFSCIDGGVG